MLPALCTAADTEMMFETGFRERNPSGRSPACAMSQTHPVPSHRCAVDANTSNRSSPSSLNLSVSWLQHMMDPILPSSLFTPGTPAPITQHGSDLLIHPSCLLCRAGAELQPFIYSRNVGFLMLPHQCTSTVTSRHRPLLG